MRHDPGGFTVIFFDVGQGDGALLHFPNGAAMVVDAGGGFLHWDAGRRLIYPELARRGILSLDRLVLSHPDRDHAQGIFGLIGTLPVGGIWFHGAERGERKPLFVDISRRAALHGVPLRPVSAEVRETVGGVALRWIPARPTSPGRNDRALILDWEFAGCRGLFTGDIEVRGERWLLRQNVGPVDLLKVPHHGSKTSSTPAWLEAVRPRWAVFSAGERNSYGHPHRRILSRYRARNSEIFRTDFHGYVRFTISSSGWVECETAHGSCGRARCQRAVSSRRATTWGWGR